MQNLFNGTLESLAGVELEQPLSNAKAPCCEYYHSRYMEARKKAGDEGQASTAAVYTFLEILTSFHPSFDTPEKPYVPFMQMDGRRTHLPEDLTPDDIAVIRKLLLSLKAPALIARLHDICWIVEKDHACCAEAAKHYVEAAKILNNVENWTFASTYFRRGIYLASLLGRDKELFKGVVSNLDEATRKTATDEKGYRFSSLLDVMFDFKVGDFSSYATLVSQFAAKLEQSGDFFAAKGYRESESKLNKSLKNSVAEKAARISAAENLISEAKRRASEGDRSLLAAGMLLSEGIEALRQAGGDPVRAKELRKLLIEYQEGAVKEMKPLSVELDISQQVMVARKHVESKDLREALLKFAFGRNLISPEELKKETLRMIEKFPASHLFTRSIVDDKGRVVAKQGGGLEALSGAAGDELEGEMFAQAARGHWPLRVAGYIEPARTQIFNDHHPTLRDLAYLVNNNPFVPSDHEGIFLRGIHAGFQGDFLLATHLLVPQIENSVRHVLETRGVDVSNLNSDGTQPVKLLGPLMGMPETTKIFGPSFVFELRGCLIEKSGYDFRNHVAHGFVSETECYSFPAVTLWWLVVRMCSIPIYHDIMAKTSENDGGEAEKPPEA